MATKETQSTDAPRSVKVTLDQETYVAFLAHETERSSQMRGLRLVVLVAPPSLVVTLALLLGAGSSAVGVVCLVIVAALWLFGLGPSLWQRIVRNVVRRGVGLADAAGDKASADGKDSGQGSKPASKPARTFEPVRYDLGEKGLVITQHGHAQVIPYTAVTRAEQYDDMFVIRTDKAAMPFPLAAFGSRAQAEAFRRALLDAVRTAHEG